MGGIGSAVAIAIGVDAILDAVVVVIRLQCIRHAVAVRVAPVVEVLVLDVGDAVIVVIAVAPAIARIHGALAHPATPTPLPANSAGYLCGTPFDTGDPRVDTILMSILESVGAIGYQRTHVVTATDAAQVSETFAFMRYPTKLDLFLAVIQTGYAQAYDDIRAFRESVAAVHGIGLAEAVTWREYLAPDVAERRIASIETDRLTLHNPRMRQAAIAADTAILDSILLDVPKAQRSAMTGHLHLDFASGHGLPLIGILLPDSWQLPFDVVTVPETARHPMPS